MEENSGGCIKREGPVIWTAEILFLFYTLEGIIHMFFCHVCAIYFISVVHCFSGEIGIVSVFNAQEVVQFRIPVALIPIYVCRQLIALLA